MKRRLSAVLHADVEGYSRLMSEDEAETVRTLTEYRHALEGLVEEHGGRVVDTAGDGFLLEFPSVINALDFAVSFQRDINERNIDLPESRRMKFRIGIDVGEIIDQGDKIFGDAVNIAARLEGLAEGGGICISGNAYDQAKKRSRLTYQYLGEKVLKNIGEPVRAYCVLMEPIAQSNDKEPRSSPTSMRWGKRLAIAVGLFLVMATAVSVWHFYVRHVPHPSENPTEETRASSPDEQPSIAVIPFSNLSGDPGQEFFSDGITEEIITTLSKVPDFLVIAGNSSFAVKGKPLDIQQFRRDLRARYLLQGSVRKEGDRVRVTAQLIDAETGNHLWAERYDQQLKDILKLQEEITAQVVSAIQVKLAPWKKAWMRPEIAPSVNLQALEKFMQAMVRSGKEDKEQNMRARSLLEQAIDFDPDSSRAYAALARTYLLDLAMGWSTAPHESVANAETYAQKSITLDDSSDFAHLVMSRVHLFKREHDAALQEAQRAVTLNPNGADGLASLAHILVFSGRPEEAVKPLEKAIRLNPISPNWYYSVSGNAFMGMNQYEKAIEAYRKAIHDKPHKNGVLMFLAATYSLADRQAEARKTVEELLRLAPRFSVERAAEKLPYKNPKDLERIVAALRVAGMK